MPELSLSVDANHPNIGLLIQAQCQQDGDKPFLIFPETDTTWTYTELEQQVFATAGLLTQSGIQAGDKVAILLPNIPAFLTFYWGAMVIGAVACPINTLLKGPEIAYVTEHSDAKVFVTTPEFFGEVSRILDDLHGIQQVIVVHDTPEATGTLNPSQCVYYEDALASVSQDTINACRKQSQAIPADAPAMIIYTSGTTGKPKGVVLTHHNLLTDARLIRDWFKLTPDSRFMCILPLFHVNGEVVTLMTPLVTGASVVLNRKFSASRFWPTIQQYQVTLFSTVPTILSVLLASPKPTEAMSSLQFGICGAAPLPVEVHKQFEDTFGVPIYEGYGLSETTCYSTFNPPSVTQRKIGSIGLAVGQDVAIWREDNTPADIEEGGEIVVRGENVMKEYFKNPDATQKAFAGGWFHTGDWGKQDADGFFYILDRVKDMIIRGGENIYPREVDEVLYAHPAVDAAATIGIPCEKYGESVKSYVVLKPNHHVGAQELIDYCKSQLANYKCPEAIAFIPEIPKGPTGKLLRRELRALASESEPA
jgi:long-chain acyl-CoA synthetase